MLIACVEYDSGDRQAAETTRQAALSLGTEADHAEIKAWAHEIRAWIALTTGNYHGVVARRRTGIEAAPHHSVAIQLSAQEAKAWARIGDRRQTEVALDKGRRLLEAMPYPDNLDHHFVVDPTKFDFYMMDCYRHLAEDRMAETLATEVIQASTDFDGTERAPMRLAEARITLGVVAARQGDLEQAIHQGDAGSQRSPQVTAVAAHGQPRSHQGPERPVPERTRDAGLPRPASCAQFVNGFMICSGSLRTTGRCNHQLISSSMTDPVGRLLVYLADVHGGLRGIFGTILHSSHMDSYIWDRFINNYCSRSYYCRSLCLL